MKTKILAVAALATMAFAFLAQAQPFGQPQTVINGETILGRRTNSSLWRVFYSPPYAKDMAVQLSCMASNTTGGGSGNSTSNLVCVIQPSLDGVLFEPLQQYVTTLVFNTALTNYVQVTNWTINGQTTFRLYLTNSAGPPGGDIGTLTNVYVKVNFK